MKNKSSTDSNLRFSRRKKPNQQRSKATVDSILQATTQIIQKEGWPNATINKIIERSGVSVGSLYQYFPNREATYRKNKRPFLSGPEVALTANDSPGNRSIAPNGPEFHSRRCNHAHLSSTVVSIPDFRHGEFLLR